MIEMSEAQRKTAACALTLLSVAVIACFILLLGWLVVGAIAFLSPAITPVLFGLFLALFFRPYYAFWLRLFKRPGPAVATVLVTVLVPVGVVLWNFGAFIVRQLFEFAETAPALFARVTIWFNETFPVARSAADSLGIPYGEWCLHAKSTLLSSAIRCCGYTANLINLLVSLIFFFYFLTRPRVTGRDVVSELPFLKPATKDFVSEQIDAFLTIMVSFFQRQVLICLVEGALYGTGFWLVGLPHGFFLGFLLGMLNLVPFLGTVVCLPMALPLAYWGDGGSLGRFLAVMAVWLTGQVLDGYLITPKIQGDKTGLGYAGVIFSFLFWGVVFHSLIGLLLAIPLSAFCLVLWRALKSRIIKPVI